MSGDLFATQTALFDALVASGAIQSLIGSPPRLYDHVPVGSEFPYITFGAIGVQPYDTKTESGFEQIVTLEIWSRYRGSKEAKDILQAVYDVLHRATLTITGDLFLFCGFHGAELGLEPDGITYRAAIRFTLITQSA